MGCEIYLGGVEVIDDVYLHPSVAINLILQAKFVAKVNEDILLWFIPVGDLIAVVVDKYKKEEKDARYYLTWYPAYAFRTKLWQYYRAPEWGFHIHFYWIRKMEAVVVNWTEEEKKEAKRWWKVKEIVEKASKLPIHKRLYYRIFKDKLEDIYEEGITKGYYLLKPSTLAVLGTLKEARCCHEDNTSSI